MGFSVCFGNVKNEKDKEIYDINYVINNPGLYVSVNNNFFKILTINKKCCLFLDTDENIIEQLDTLAWKNIKFYLETDTVTMEISND